MQKLIASIFNRCRRRTRPAKTDPVAPFRVSTADFTCSSGCHWIEGIVNGLVAAGSLSHDQCTALRRELDGASTSNNDPTDLRLILSATLRMAWLWEVCLQAMPADSWQRRQARPVSEDYFRQITGLLYSGGPSFAPAVEAFALATTGTEASAKAWFALRKNHADWAREGSGKNLTRAEKNLVAACILARVWVHQCGQLTYGEKYLYCYFRLHNQFRQPPTAQSRRALQSEVSLLER